MDTATTGPGDSATTAETRPDDGEQAPPPCDKSPLRPGSGSATGSTGTKSIESDEKSTTGTGTNAGLASLPKIYRNIRAAKLLNMTVRTLGGCAVKNFSSIGSFVGDPRFCQSNTRFSYNTRVNRSTSFETTKLMCNTCATKGDHPVMHRDNLRVDRANQSPCCFILTDQNFPPMVPVSGEGECLKIISIEDARLFELADAFLEITKGFSISAGSVVMIFSASHLAWAGIASYAKDWVTVRGKINQEFRGGVELLNGFPLLQSATGNKGLIRSLIDLELWHDSLNVNQSRDICKARKSLFDTLFADTEPFVEALPEAGPPLVPDQSDSPLASGSDPCILRLPLNTNSNSEATFVSPGYVKMPSSLEPLSCEQEVDLILLLIRELNEKFVLDLDEDIEVQDRNLIVCDEPEPAQEERKFLIVGNSHGSRLTNALEDMGYEAKCILATDWASDPAVNSRLVNQIKSEVEQDDGNLVIVYFLYNNEVYLVESEDGELTAPVKQAGSSRYHINGKLTIANRDKF
jgi:hypothetical protein